MIAGDAAGDVAAGKPRTSNTFRGRPRMAAVVAAASVVVGGDGCCYCYRKTSGPGHCPGGRSARSKVQSCMCNLIALAGDVVAVAAAGDAAVGSVGVMIAVEVCSGLFGRLVEPKSRCFAFEDQDLSSGSWTYW